MNENELREAMRATMTVTPPPPMESAAALTAGRRAVRRRATLAGGGAAAVVIAVTALAVNSGLHVSASGNQPWAGQPSAFPSAIGTPSDENTKPVWPLDGDGQPQEDATARSGERYEQGKKLLTEVLAVVPDSFTTPAGKPTDESPLQYHQAQVEGDNSGKTWSYLAHAAVAKGGGTGQLLAEVHTKDNGLPQEPCALAKRFWELGGKCTVVRVGAAEVGVASPPPGDSRLEKWAAYRHPDGTVVFVAQSREFSVGNATLKPLTKLPLTVPQLAALAVDDRFHLS